MDAARLCEPCGRRAPACAGGRGRQDERDHADEERCAHDSIRNRYSGRLHFSRNYTWGSRETNSGLQGLATVRAVRCAGSMISDAKLEIAESVVIPFAVLVMNLLSLE
jgi:hypothetical protein